MNLVWYLTEGVINISAYPVQHNNNIIHFALLNLQNVRRKN